MESSRKSGNNLTVLFARKRREDCAATGFDCEDEHKLFRSNLHAGEAQKGEAQKLRILTSSEF